MKDEKPVIAIAFTRTEDIRLVSGFLESLGMEVMPCSAHSPPEKPVELLLLEDRVARAASWMADIRRKSEIFLPFVVAVTGSQQADFWLGAGFDACLHMPVSKAELRSTLNLLLRLRRQAQELVRQGLERYMSVFQSTGTATIVVDADGRIVMANRNCEPVTGYVPEKLVGTPWMNYVAPESLSRMLEYFRLRIESPEKAPYQYETRLVDKAGCVRDVILSVGQVQNSSQFIVSMVDITELRQVQARHQMLFTAVEQASETIVITDVTGAIQYVNPAFSTVTGYAAKEVLGKNPRILKSGEHDEAFYRDLWAQISSGRVWRGRFVNRRRDGTLYTEDAAISPVRSDAGIIINYVAVKRDITQELQEAKTRASLEEQLRRSMRLEALGRLAGGIAHDFNNILGVILGYGDMVLSGLPDGHPVYADVAEMLSAARRAADLTRQLLMFSRQQPVELAPLVVDDVMAGMERMLRRLIPENIQLKMEMASAPARVMADRSQLEQVILNLAINARDAMPQGGVLRIASAPVTVSGANAGMHPGIDPGAYVRLMVSDTGCGMTPDVQERIFEPFFTTKETGRGAGLGLSTVYGIVAQAGGTIRVDSSPGRGTAFAVYWPQTAKSHPDVPEAKASAGAPVVGSGIRVLVVEDEESLRRLLERLLRKSGFDVRCAACGEDAAAWVKAGEFVPDVLVTDMVMPGISGLETASLARAVFPDMPVVFMSGHIKNHPLQAQLDDNACFLQKPFHADEFLNLIRAVVKKRNETI